MQAMVYYTYGSPDVLQPAAVQTPVPQAGQVLIKVAAAAVGAGDWHLLRADPFLVRLAYGLFKPKYQILGADVAGQVTAVSANVTQFRPGDEVFGDLSQSGFGAFAEYVAAPATAFALKPTNLSFAEAAAVPASGVTALQALRMGKLQAGQRVLINGASGGVGTFAVQLAKAFGAEVTAVCSTRNVELVRALGADCVIDYKQSDFSQNGQRYDLILAANGYRPLATYQQALAPQGTYVMSGGTTRQMFEAMLLGPLRSKRDGQKLGNMLVKPNQPDLLIIKALIEVGKVKPVIDRHYPLPAVADAIRYLEAGHAQGKVVITVTDNA